MDQQLRLLNPDPYRSPGYLTIDDDYGAIGQGASQAHYVRAENGHEYIIKGPDLSPYHPYVAANEFIAASLATALGLPLLDFRIVSMSGRLYFASSWMQKDTFCPFATADLFQQCRNKDRVYDMILFDAWICNTDRHHQNLIIRRVKSRQDIEDRYLLVLNDHSHCLVLPGQTPSFLPTLVDSSLRNYMRSELDFIRQAIIDPVLVANSLGMIESLLEEIIVNIVRELPDEWLINGSDREDFLRFLLDRRSKLREVLDRDKSLFPNLRGG